MKLNCKHLFAIFLSILMVVGMFSMTALAVVSTGLSGSGTEADPYLINDIYDLIWFRDKVDNVQSDRSNQFLGKYVKLNADIDLAGINWNPIGEKKDHGSFMGIFDGGDHTISNLYVEQAGEYLGLFAYTGSFNESEQAVIKNLTLNNVTVKSTNNSNYVGGLVGNATTTNFENIHVTGTVEISGRGYIGGIVGHGYSDFNNVSVKATNGTISSTFWCAGGVIGYLGEGSTVKNAVVEGLTIESAAGGLGSIVGMASSNDGTQPCTGENLSAKNVAIQTYTGAYGDSYAEYSLGYLIGGDTSVMTGSNTVENVTFACSNGTTNPDVSDAVASVNGTIYFDLQAALDAAAAGTGNVTVEILRDVNLNGVDWNPVTVSANGYPVVTVNGNNKTITGLNDMLFAGTWAGKSGLIINDLTIKDSNIVNDKDDTAGTVGVGAFIGFPQASETITLNNCHLVDSTVEGGHWTGGLIGYAAGYAGNDGPVFMNLTIKDCSVTGSTITGKGSAGGVIGHGSGNGWTNVVIENTTVSGNTITSTGSSTNKAGAVMGTIGAAGQPTTANGVTLTGGASVSATVSGNTVTSAGTTITTIYGRQGTSTGMLYVTGGTYDKYPIEENVSYAAPAEGHVIIQNADSTYGVAVDPTYGKVAKIGDTYYSSLQEAIEAGGNIVLISDVDLTAPLTVPADATVVLDLNGKTVTYDSTTQGEAMITNKGNLTIDDTVGTGVINYNYTGAADSTYSKGNYTISNGGTLTVNGGKITIANLSSHAKYPIDNNSTTGDAILVINGGHLYNYNTSAIRQFCNSTTNKNSVTINGGLIEGYCAIWVQNPGSKTVNGSLSITGGEIRTTAKAYVNGTAALKDVSSRIYCTTEGGAWDAASAVSITGGTINENVNLAEEAPESITVDETTATFNGYVELPDVLSGSGTETDPFLIDDINDLKWFRDDVNAGSNTYVGQYVKLNANIDLASENWTPIGNDTNYFMGTFDGGYNTISNMTINVNSTGNVFAGLFGGIKQATVKNLTMTNVNITAVGVKVRAAAVVGIAHSGSVNSTVATINFENITVDGCTIDATATSGSALLGGVVGYSYPANMSNITVSDLTIDGKAEGNEVRAAAINGYVCGQNISNNGNTRAPMLVDTFNVSNVTITAEGYTVFAGGYAPYTYYGYITLKNGNIDDLKITVDAHEAFVGGLVGYFWRSDNGHTVENVDITNIDFDVTTDYLGETRIGGVVGTSQSPNTKYNDVYVSGKIVERCSDPANPVNYHAKVGGFVARTYEYAQQTYTNCVADVDVTGSNIAGGFVGNHNSTVSYVNCEAKGDVTADTAGGFAGRVTEHGYTTDVTFDSCKASGTVTGTNVAGGFIGSTANHGWAAWAAGNGTAYGKNITLKDCVAAANVTTTNDTGYCAGVVGEAKVADGKKLTLNNVTYTVNPAVYPYIAEVNGVGYMTLQEAIEAAQPGETVILMADIKLTEADCVAGADLKVLLDVDGKDITLNLNGKKISVVHEDAFTSDDYIVAVIRVGDGAGLTVTGNGTIDVKVLADNPDIAYMFWKRGTTGHLTIENGTFHMNDSADSMVYTNGNEIVTIKGGNWTLDNLDDENGPWIFNVKGAGDNHVIVTGGTYNADVNRQKWSNEVLVSETCYTVANADGTWTVKEGAAAYVSTGMNTGPYFVRKNIGYATLKEAIEAAVQYSDPHVTLLADYEGTLTITGEVKLHLNGHTIKSDASTIVVDGGDLTVYNDKANTSNKVNDALTFEKATTEGKIITTDTTGDGEAIAVKNNGKLTLNGGTVESGKYGLYAYSTVGIIVMNGGTVKAPYMAIAVSGGSATVSGGTLICDESWIVYDWDKNVITITGGLFSQLPDADYLAEGKTVEKTTVDSKTYYQVVDAKPIAFIGETGYYTIAEAIDAAQPGNTITVNSCFVNGNVSINKDVTVQAAEGATVTINGDLSITADGATVKGLTVVSGGTALYINAKDVLVEGCDITGAWSGMYQSYTTGKVTFKDSKITGKGAYAIHFDGYAGGEIVIDNCELSGWTSFAASIKNVTITDTDFVEGTENYLRFYQENVVIDGCTFNEKMTIDLVDTETVNVTDSTVENGTVEDLFSGADIVNSDIYVDGELLKREAKIGNTYYKTLAEAIAAAQPGETVDLLGNSFTDVAGFSLNGFTLTNGSITFKKGARIGVHGDAVLDNVDLTFDMDGTSGYPNTAIYINGGSTTSLTLQNGSDVLIKNPGYTAIYNDGKTAYALNIDNSTLTIEGKGTSTGINIANITMTNGAALTTSNTGIAINGGSVNVDGTSAATINGTTSHGITNVVLTVAEDGKVDVDNCAYLGLNIQSGSSIAEGAIVTVDNCGTSGNYVGIPARVNGTTGEDQILVDNQKIVAKGVSGNAFTSINAALTAAKPGETVTILAGDYTQDLNINKAITVEGEVADDGYLLTAITGKVNITADGATVKGLYVYNNGNAAYIHAKDVLIEGCEIASGSSAFRYCYTDGTVTFKDSIIAGSVYGIHFDGSAGGNIVIDNCQIQGWTSFASTIEKVTITDSEFADGNYDVLRFYQDAEVTNTKFTAGMRIDSGDGGTGMEGIDIKFNGCSMTDGSDFEACFPESVIVKSDIYVDDVLLKREAKIGDTYYKTLAEAIAAWDEGETLTLLANAEISAPIVITESKTLDGNGKTLTYTGTDRAIQITGGTVVINDLTVTMTNAPEGSRGINLYNGGTNAAIDVTLNNVTVNGGKAYAVNIGGGNDNKLTINDSTLTGYAAINVHTSSVNHTIVVDGSTLNGKNHNNNYHFGTVVVDGTNAHSLTITNSTVTTENLEGVTNKYYQVIVGANCTYSVNAGIDVAVRNVYNKNNGLYYIGLASAIATAEDGNTIVLLGNETISETIKVNANVTLDLNGKTITGTDNETKSFALIEIQPGAELTINDTVGTGKITLIATNDRDWNAYSSVISNQRGKLTVNGGTIEHLGGTDMAYGIDNLTNGKDTYAETIIEDGTVKSTYRAIRQFLNGVEADNILTVNGGTIEGANKSIWMQDPNKNANSGTLTVTKDAVLKGDVYLYVTPESTEWPVEVSIADAAFEGTSTVITGNVPAGYVVENSDGIWGVREATYVAKIGETKYESLAEALTAAKDGDTITLIWAEGDAPIAMNGAVYGKTVTITGTATVDWSKGFLFVGRGGAGNGTVIFDNANLTSASNSASYGIHVSGREKDTNNKYDGTLIIKNSTIELDYLINKGTMTLDNSTLTVKNGFSIGGRPASETESGVDATATISLTNGSKVVVNNHNGMGLGYEAIGVMNIDATSAFETTQSFLVTTKGTMNIAGTAIVAGTLTNSGSIVLTDATATLTSSECGNVTTTVDGYEVAYENGEYSLVAANYVAQIGETKYTSLQAAIDAAQSGDTIVLLADIAENVTISQNLTIDGAGKIYTGNILVNDSVNKNVEVTIKKVNFGTGSDYAITTSRIKSITVEDCTVTGRSFLYAKLATPNITVKNVQITGGNYVAHIVYGEKAYFENVTATAMTGFGIYTQNYGAKTITLKNCSFDTPNYKSIGMRDDRKYTVDTFIFEGANTMTSMYNGEYAKYVLGAADATLTAPEGLTVTTTVDGYEVVYENGAYSLVAANYVAQIGENKYTSLQAAIDAAQPDETIVLLTDINLADCELQVLGGKYSTYFLVENKSVTINLNEKTISGEYTGDSMLVGVFSIDNNGHLTLTGNGTVDVTATKTVYSLLVCYSDGSSMTIENGTYKLDKASDNLIYYGGATDAAVTIKGGSFTLGYIDDENSPWIFNVKGAGDHHVLIEGGTFNADINRQKWSSEVMVSKTCYTVDNGDGTWTVKEGAVAYVNTGMLTGPYYAPKDIGYATIEEAFAAAVGFNDENITLLANVQLTKDVEISIAGIVLNADGFTLDCNGYAIILTDVAATLEAAEGLNVTTTVDGYEVAYADGKYALKATAPVVSVTGKSLLLEDIVQIKYYIGFAPEIKDSITAAGLYVWNNESDANALNFSNAIWHNTEIRDEGMYQGNYEYSFRSDGIPAKEMGDLQYVVAYIVVNGETHYTAVEAYSPKTWCENKKDDPKEKNIAAALMNYGAAAQIRFDYKTDVLMNVGFDNYTFTTDMLTNTTRVKGADLNGFRENGYSLVLEGTIQYKIYYAASGLSGKSGLGIEYKIGDGEFITIEGFEANGSSEYFVKIDGVAAKDLDELITVRPFYTENGERVYGNESQFCAETWIYNKMTSTKTDATTLKDKAIAPALGNYIIAANQRFSD